MNDIKIINVICRFVGFERDLLAKPKIIRLVELLGNYLINYRS